MIRLGMGLMRGARVADQARRDLSAFVAHMAGVGKTIDNTSRDQYYNFAKRIYAAIGRTDFISLRAAHQRGSGADIYSFHRGQGSLTNGPRWDANYIEFLATNYQLAHLPSWRWHLPGAMIAVFQLPGTVSPRTVAGGLQTNSSAGIILGTYAGGNNMGVGWFTPSFTTVGGASTGMYDSVHNVLASDFGASTKVYKSGGLHSSSATLPTMNSTWNGVRLALHGDVFFTVNITFVMSVPKSLTPEQHLEIYNALKEFYPDLLT
jgi:hypothetical protein